MTTTLGMSFESRYSGNHNLDHQVGCVLLDRNTLGECEGWRGNCDIQGRIDLEMHSNCQNNW